MILFVIKQAKRVLRNIYRRFKTFKKRSLMKLRAFKYFPLSENNDGEEQNQLANKLEQSKCVEVRQRNHFRVSKLQSDKFNSRRFPNNFLWSLNYFLFFF